MTLEAIIVTYVYPAVYFISAIFILPRLKLLKVVASKLTLMETPFLGKMKLGPLFVLFTLVMAIIQFFKYYAEHQILEHNTFSA